MTPTTKLCPKCGLTQDAGAFNRNAANPDGLARECRSCAAVMRAARHGATAKAQFNAAYPRSAAEIAADATADLPVTKAARTSVLSDYRPSKELVATWAAVLLSAADGDPADNLLFVGPSGSGKTEAARYLAALSGLPFTKVDAPSMTDPEAWFGTREVVVEDGAPKTVFTESAFCTAVQNRGVLLIDEGNRVSDAIRGILLAFWDDTRTATNPLTGQPVMRHPECFIIMTGNVGLNFTGTYAIDPAFLTRALTTNFDYLDADAEIALAISRTGCDQDTASLFVRFADETRQRAKTTEDFPPISTREVLKACRLVGRGLDPNTAAHQVMINAASGEGGGESIRFSLEAIWTGIRNRTA